MKIISKPMGTQWGEIEVIELDPSETFANQWPTAIKNIYVIQGQISIQGGTQPLNTIHWHEVVVIPEMLPYSITNPGNILARLLVTRALPVKADEPVYSLPFFNPVNRLISIRSKSDCSPLETNPGEKIFELTGSVTGHDTLSLEEIELGPHRATQNHYHPNREEIYLLLEGKALVSIGGYQYQVKTFEMFVIPPMTEHQIYNPEGSGILRFLTVCFPSWKPGCGLYIGTPSDKKDFPCAHY